MEAPGGHTVKLQFLLSQETQQFPLFSMQVLSVGSLCRPSMLFEAVHVQWGLNLPMGSMKDLRFVIQLGYLCP